MKRGKRKPGGSRESAGQLHTECRRLVLSGQAPSKLADAALWTYGPLSRRRGVCVCVSADNAEAGAATGTACAERKEGALR